MILRAFGVEERPFLLLVPQWRELEKLRDCGLGIIAARLAPMVQLRLAKGRIEVMAALARGQFGDVRLDDVRGPILYGLIGGGMPSTEAAGLVRNVFDEAVGTGGAVYQWCGLAFDIVTAALIGLPDEAEDRKAPGESKAAPAKPARRRSPTARPASASSTPG